MKAFLLSTLFLTSCLTHRTTGEFAVLSPPRQKQKIVLLEKKLKRAEKEQREIQEEVDRLSSAVKEAQLALIRKQVEEYQDRLQSNPKKNIAQGDPSILFLKEREMLHKILSDGALTNTFEAQHILDQILEMITTLSD